MIYKRWAAMALLALMFAFVNMVFDYAKIGTVVKDSKGMFRETFRALRFTLRNFLSAFGLYLIIAITGLALFLALNYLRWSVDQSSAGTVLLAILLGQIVIAGRMWTRLVFIPPRCICTRSWRRLPRHRQSNLNSNSQRPNRLTALSLYNNHNGKTTAFPFVP